MTIDYARAQTLEMLSFDVFSSAVGCAPSRLPSTLIGSAVLDLPPGDPP